MIAPVLSLFVPILVIDTNVLIGALLSPGGGARRVIRACLTGDYAPIVGAALFAEYEDVLGRDSLWTKSPLSVAERTAVFDGFMSVCRWVEVFFAWRPNLPDEADNHLIEIAVAGNANAVVTRNIRDFSGGDLRFPALPILTPAQCLETYPCQR
jgi:putative PIN family toxin of toxin-antitoxin system